MATLYIAEYAEVSLMLGGRLVMVPVEPPLAEQTLSIGGSSVQSSAFNAGTQVVRLNTDSACSVLFGTNPTAAATNGRKSAGATEYHGVPRGQSFKVAVITNS